MLKRYLICAPLIALLAIVGGCSLTDPSDTTLSGTWHGTAVASGAVGGTGTIDANFAQSGDTFTGTWGATYQNPIFNDSGPVSGSVLGTAVTMTLRSGAPGRCDYDVTGELSQGGTALNGTFAVVNCLVPFSGQFQIVKQQ